MLNNVFFKRKGCYSKQSYISKDVFSHKNLILFEEGCHVKRGQLLQKDFFFEESGLLFHENVLFERMPSLKKYLSFQRNVNYVSLKKDHIFEKRFAMLKPIDRKNARPYSKGVSCLPKTALFIWKILWQKPHGKRVLPFIDIYRVASWKKTSYSAKHPSVQEDAFLENCSIHSYSIRGPFLKRNIVLQHRLFLQKGYLL